MTPRFSFEIARNVIAVMGNMPKTTLTPNLLLMSVNVENPMFPMTHDR